MLMFKVSEARECELQASTRDNPITIPDSLKGMFLEESNWRYDFMGFQVIANQFYEDILHEAISKYSYILTKDLNKISLGDNWLFNALDEVNIGVEDKAFFFYPDVGVYKCANKEKSNQVYLDNFFYGLIVSLYANKYILKNITIGDIDGKILYTYLFFGIRDYFIHGLKAILRFSYDPKEILQARLALQALYFFEDDLITNV